MAKMFYTLEETAEALGIDTEKVKELAGDGRLQQFRDRDKLMFKRDQVDTMVSTRQEDTDDDQDDIIPLSETSMGDQIDLASETAAGQTGSGRTGTGAPKTDETKAGSGVSIFESGEMELADPAAQTHVTESSSMDDEALALESVGSGSGLLDLTRESDDTSLGAELLDEIYPSDDSQAGASALGASALAESALGASAMDASGLGSGMGSGVLEGAAAELEGSSIGTGIGSGLEAIPEPSGLSGLAGAPTYATVAEVQDPAWSGALAGALLGVTIVLFIALAIAAGAVVGVPTGITAAIAGSLWMYVGVMLGGCLLLGFIGMFIGKMGG